MKLKTPNTSSSLLEARLAKMAVHRSADTVPLGVI
jgi:hypothetical protein